MTMTFDFPQVDKAEMLAEARKAGQFRTSVKATAAHRLLCVMGDWACADVLSCDMSSHGQMLFGHGYKSFLKFFDDDHVFLILRAAAEGAIEVHTLIAYPDRRGHGSAVMTRLCAAADELGVQLWLNAVPFGEGRTQIPLPKLKGYYRRFGFFPIKHLRSEWLCGFHRWERSRLTDLMLRNPQGPNR